MADQQSTMIIRKRQQIANANRTMFLWVAMASVIVGASAVGIVFLAQKAWFNERVLAEKSKTASVLDKNIKTIDALKNQVRVMNTNQALHDAMAPGETQPIQVVLDALPADANSSALGSSLQKKFLDDPKLKVETLRLDPVVGVESSDSSVVQDASTTTGDNQISFGFTVSTASSDVSALKDLLQRLERSIRAINVTTLTVEGQGNRVSMTVEGTAYYEPAKTVELKDKTIKP